MSEASVEFEGDFRPGERALLAGQFGACRFRLLGRSVLGADLALVEWEAVDSLGSGGPRPLAAAPRRAYYAVDASHQRLDRVDASADLATRYPEHFPGVRLRQGLGDRVRRLLRDVWPALMLAVLSIWILVFVLTCRPFG